MPKFVEYYYINLICFILVLSCNTAFPFLSLEINSKTPLINPMFRYSLKLIKNCNYIIITKETLKFRVRYHANQADDLSNESKNKNNILNLIIWKWTVTSQILSMKYVHLHLIETSRPYSSVFIADPSWKPWFLMTNPHVQCISLQCIFNLWVNSDPLFMRTALLVVTSCFSYEESKHKSQLVCRA